MTLAPQHARAADWSHLCAAAEQVPEGVDLAVQKMKKGETAEVTLSPQYAFGAEGAQQPGGAVPPNATVTYTVQLQEFDNVGPYQLIQSIGMPDQLTSCRHRVGHEVEAAAAANSWIVTMFPRCWVRQGCWAGA